MKVSEDKRQTYAGLIVMKLIDLGPDNGGLEIPRELPRELAPLQEILEEMRFNGLIEVSAKKRGALAALRGKSKEEFYGLTQSGVEHLGRLIDEAEGYVTEFDALEVAEMIDVAHERKLDPMRVRFLWGWFEGEFDDLALFQERRAIDPVERLWAYYLTSNEFWDEVSKDLIV